MVHKNVNISPKKNCNRRKLFFNINEKDNLLKMKKFQDADDQFLNNLLLNFSIFDQRELSFCINLMLSNFYFALFLTRLYEAMDSHLWKIYSTIERKHIKNL